MSSSLSLRSRARALGLPTALVLALPLATCTNPRPSAAASETPGAAPAAPLPDGCAGAAVESSDGRRRLALLVGVGAYRSPRIPALAGPAGDVGRMQQLLTAEGGYGFPRENVCVLLDSAATVAGFRRAFDEALVKRARPGKGDIALLYYAGHGSVTEDVSGDEWDDDKDSTLVLHDSRTGGVRDLVDDEIFELLQRLGERTENVTIISDSCHSGTITRGDATTLVPRFVPEEPGAPATQPAPRGAGTDLFQPRALSGVVVLSAASDREPAFEDEGHGIFTDAVVEVLGAVGKTPLSFRQASIQIRARVAARSRQTPFFHGNLDTIVLSAERRSQPVGLRVTRVGDALALGGPPMPGLGKNAELRIYDGAIAGADTRDPAKAKATAVVRSTTGLTTEAVIATRGPVEGAVKEGDLALLVRPADEDLRLPVRLRKPGAPGGVPAERASAIARAVDADPEARAMVALLADDAAPAAFELSLASGGWIELRDSERRLRFAYATGGGEPGAIAKNLWQHARQAALLRIRPEPGSSLEEEKTLAVTLVPDDAARQPKCARGRWIAATAGQPYVAPLCWRYRVHVRNQGTTPLLVGALALFSDGGIEPLSDVLNAPLGPGKEQVLAPIVTGPPLDVADHVLVFGTLPNAPVDWALLASPVDERARRRERGTRGEQTPLFEALARLVPGTRGGAVERPRAEDAPWTRSTAQVVVKANEEFARAEIPEDGSAPGTPTKREYTVAIDVATYLPEDPQLGTYKLLRSMDWLAHRSVTDGVPYRQHDWSGATDDANLAKGIDCSRAVWFAYRKAGLRYNRRDAYQATVDMVRADTLMKDEFDRCDGKPLRLGDVLVYRDDGRGDGHTVVVVDPDGQIGWGAHGYDGNVNEGKEPDTGVEYQKIKKKPDWMRWDRKNMLQKACWRHRKLAAEADKGSAKPAGIALDAACDEARACGRRAP
ncbi:MAG TPA: caspase family protein [Anaeromyxobacter sp.]|nr:caspase family protein [Anaeromyxobacter sp.]